MRQTVTIEDARMLGSEPQHCPNCGHHVPPQIRSRIDREALTVLDSPLRAYWRGAPVSGLSETKTRLLRLLVHFGEVSSLALLCALGEETGDDTLRVHIWALRRLLREQTDGRVDVQAKRGWGYQLIIKDEQ